MSGPSDVGVLTETDRRTLLDVAVTAIGTELRTRKPWTPDVEAFAAPLRELGASFVTLERAGALLGCVGSLEPIRPLAVDVAHSARLAAFDDPRLPPVDVAAYREMSVKVSVLSPLEPMPAETREAVLGWLTPGRDGVLLAMGGRRATFLPAVWASLPDPREFLAQLVAKALLPADVWPPDTRAWRYSTTEFGDPGPRPAP